VTHTISSGQFGRTFQVSCGKIPGDPGCSWAVIIKLVYYMLGATNEKARDAHTGLRQRHAVVDCRPIEVVNSERTLRIVVGFSSLPSKAIRRELEGVTARVHVTTSRLFGSR